MSSVCLLVPVSLHGGLPALTHDEVEVISSTTDESEVPDKAFAVLADHVNRWEDSESTEPIRLRVAVELIMATPAIARGELYRLEGSLLERRRMPPPHGDVAEWILRLPTGEPVMVYLPEEDATGTEADGRPVGIDARFYKVISAVARDGQVRRYPAFFGAAPTHVADGQAVFLGRMDILMLLGFLVLLVLVALTVLAVARRQGGTPPRPVRDLVEPRCDMPDDPAEALRTLRARGERSNV